MATQLPPFDVALLSLPDDQLGLHAYAWWAVAQAEKLGISQEQITPEIAERLRQKMLTLDTDNENLAGVEKALQVIANGDLARGGRMFRDHLRRQAAARKLFDEATTGRERQRANARKPRGDALGALILGIMERNPAITQNQLLTELRKHERGGVIESINDDEAVIEWVDKDRLQDTRFSGLKDRMSRARKILRSR